MKAIGSVPETIPLVLVAGWIWVIADCIRSRRLKQAQKIAWLVALIVLNVLAAIVYWLSKLLSQKEAPALPVAS